MTSRTRRRHPGLPLFFAPHAEKSWEAWERGYWSIACVLLHLNCLPQRIQSHWCSIIWSSNRLRRPPWFWVTSIHWTSIADVVCYFSMGYNFTNQPQSGQTYVGWMSLVQAALHMYVANLCMFYFCELCWLMKNANHYTLADSNCGAWNPLNFADLCTTSLQEQPPVLLYSMS